MSDAKNTNIKNAVLAKGSHSMLLPVLVFLVLLIATISAGIFLYQYEVSVIENSQHDELAVIANLKVS